MFYFIINGNSRSGRGNKVWKKVEAELKKNQIEYKVYQTTRPGDARQFAKKVSEESETASKIIVALGGDGTMNEVLDGLLFEKPVTLGYIPAGSGNDLARSLGISFNAKKALYHILSPKHYKVMDYGVVSYGSDEVAHRRFCVSSGMGFDAAVCHELLYSDIKKKMSRFHLEKLLYLFVGCKRFILAKPVKGYIVLDGVRKIEFQNLYFIAAHIHPFEGGGFRFAPNADDTDGMLEVAVCNGDSKKRLFGAMVHAYLGNKKKGKRLRTFQCRELSIHTEQPMPVHVDGESCYSQTDLQICCVNKRVRMIV